MKVLVLLSMLVLAVSCGNDGGGSGSGLQQRQESPDLIYDGLGVDLLDVMVDVPASVSDSEITFLDSKSQTLKGRRITCALGVNKDEVYYYRVTGDSLFLQTGAGPMEMTRTSGGPGIVGTWKWKGTVQDLTYKVRTMTVFRGMNRVIIRASCER
jgi:hypothetical protein